MPTKFSSIRRVLVPTDLSELSRPAIEYALDVAELTQAEVHLLHVHQPPPYDPLIFPGVVGAVTHEESLVDDAFARFVEPWGDRVAIHRRRGRPHEEILDVSERLPADLVIMSTHGRTGLSHVLIGSVAEKVVRLSKSPVLVVRPEE